MSMNKFSRMRKAKLNIASAIAYQLVSAIAGLILPRYILRIYGSETNGIMQSITQIFSYTAIFECGIGGVVLASFYKPLANNDREAVSDIFNNTKTFFKKVSLIFILLATILIPTATFIIDTNFDAVYVGSLVLILGINQYFTYYFAISHQLLLKADQKLYVVQGTQTISVVLNAFICICAMQAGFGIHMVKLLSAIVFLINPLVYRRYITKNYMPNKTIYDNTRKLPRKSDGVIHHIAYFIHRNTDIVLLSMFCGAKIVSVYSIYNYVTLMAENFMTAISNGLAGMVGNMIAKGEKGVLADSFELHERFNTLIITVFCTAASILIVPFVKIYTAGVTDINYVRPVFAYLIIAAQWVNCVRLPYLNIVNSAGYYKQTKPGACAEAIINITVSLFTVRKYGLSGVAIGTLCAILFRTVYTVWYLSKSILKRPMRKFFSKTGCNLLTGIVLIIIANYCLCIPSDNLGHWFIYAFVIAIIVALSIVSVDFINNREMYKKMFRYLRKRSVNHAGN